jgi:hypothetical protein
MGDFEGSFELLLVTAEASSANRERVRELLSESLQRIQQSRLDRYATVCESFEMPLWKAWYVVNSDLDQAMAHLGEAIAAYRQGYNLRGGELPPRGWFKAMPKLDEPVRHRADRFGPGSDVRSVRSQRPAAVTYPAAS